MYHITSVKISTKLLRIHSMFAAQSVFIALDPTFNAHPHLVIANLKHNGGNHWLSSEMVNDRRVSQHCTPLLFIRQQF
jgi:hypothetical protein